MINYSFLITLFISGLIIMFAASNITCNNVTNKQDCERVFVIGNIIGLMFMIISLLGFISKLMPPPNEEPTGRRTPI